MFDIVQAHRYELMTHAYKAWSID